MNKTTLITFIPFIIVTCSCNRLSELKRTIELRAEAKECLKRGEITNVNNLDGLSIVKLEEVANEMKEWETEERFFPWTDVALSIFQNPEGISLEAGICEHCNDTIISINFSSPQWTWEHLCGTAGRLEICPTRKIQISFKLEIMN